MTEREANVQETIERLFCMALLDEGPETIERVTSRYIKYRRRVQEAGVFGTIAYDATFAALEGEVVTTNPNPRADATT